MCRLALYDLLQDGPDPRLGDREVEDPVPLDHVNPPPSAGQHQLNPIHLISQRPLHDGEQLGVVAESNDLFGAGPQAKSHEGRGGMRLAFPADPQVRAQDKTQAVEVGIAVKGDVALQVEHLSERCFCPCLG